jgi:hypothetical protein
MTDPIQSEMIPLVGSACLACGYLTRQDYPGDGQAHQVALESLAIYGNGSLATPVDNGFNLTHRAIVTVDVHAGCSFEVAVERTLGVQLDKGASGGLMPRGQSLFVHGEGNSFYQGILEAGQAIRVIVQAPGDKVEILGGYFSVIATPV